MAEPLGDINLEEWAQTSDSPLNSDDSYTSVTGGFGDLTIEANRENNQDSNGVGGFDEEEEEEEKKTEEERQKGKDSEDKEEANEILRRLTGKFDDFNTTTKSRHRFNILTELSQDEIITEPEIIRVTDTCVTWPCDVIGDVWFKAKVYFGRKCKLPCCQEYALPHEMARHRRFCISKRYYLGDTGVTSQETDAVLRWADLVRSQEWKDGHWNERGFLQMKDTKMFVTGRVSWSAMEEHLATLAYSKKRPLVFLAARICMETMAKNRGLYSYSQQYWGFARICTDLLKYNYPVVREGILKSLQLYLRTLKIFHACFTTKCSEWASAGLFPVLMDILGRLGEAGLQAEEDLRAVVINILVLMATHASYVNLVVNMGVLDPLVTMATAQSILLRRRVFGCLEIFAKNGPTQPAMIKSGLLPLAVRQLSLNDRPMTMCCLVTLSNVCQEYDTLVKMLEVDKKLVVKAVMRLLSEEDDQSRVQIMNYGRSSMVEVQAQQWCSITRQSLLLTCKLCVDSCACEMMVKRGLIKKLKELWLDSESITERSVILEVLAVAARHSRPADKICRDTFLPILTDTFHDHVYHEQILRIALNLGKKHLPAMLECGLLPEIITAFGDKVIHRKYFHLVLSICAAFNANDKVQQLVLSNQTRAYMLILDIAFTTSDYTTLKSCVSILARLDSHRVPTHILRPNALLLVAYIDKLLKTGHDDLTLHGLLQLQDLIQVDFLHASFREHHTQKVVELLCEYPYQAPVQMIARQVVAQLSGQRSRRSSLSQDPKRMEEGEGGGGGGDDGDNRSVRSDQRKDSFRTRSFAGDEDSDDEIEEVDEDDDDDDDDDDVIGDEDNDGGAVVVVGDGVAVDNQGGNEDGSDDHNNNNNADDDDDVDDGFEIIGENDDVLL